MKFWLQLSPEPWGTMIETVILAEKAGYEGVLLADHVVFKDGERTPYPGGFPPEIDEEFVDPLIMFAAMASVTTRIKFMNNVMILPLRHPVLLAKQIATLSLISGGRFNLGVGLGWQREEFEAIGPSFTNRGKRTDAMLGIMKDFWEDGFAEATGPYYEFPRSAMFPLPTSKIPIWVGGTSNAAALRAAAHDAYMPMRPMNEETAAEFRLIDEYRESNGLYGPFEKTAPSFQFDSPEGCSVLSEKYGITSIVTLPWPWASDLPVNQKRDLMAEYAERIIHPLNGAPVVG